jgi:hypothetical protein
MIFDGECQGIGPFVFFGDKIDSFHDPPNLRESGLPACDFPPLIFPPWIFPCVCTFSSLAAVNPGEYNERQPRILETTSARELS